MNADLSEKFDDKAVIAGYTAECDGKWRYNHPEDAENYNRLAAQHGISVASLVRVHQKHTDRILTVSSENGGDGVIRDRSSEPYDGMVTDVPGLMLCVVSADCVPVYLYDPVAKAIGLVHSGRAGTILEIAGKAVLSMQQNYGTKPEHLICSLGPYLCTEHHEVQEKDITGFYDRFSEEECGRFLHFKKMRYYVDMGEAIRISLERTGVERSNISDCGICTYEHPELFSYRRDRDPERRILSFFMLKKETGL